MQGLRVRRAVSVPNFHLDKVLHLLHCVQPTGQKWNPSNSMESANLVNIDFDTYTN